jgi:hypothetical protein
MRNAGDEIGLHLGYDQGLWSVSEGLFEGRKHITDSLATSAMIEFPNAARYVRSSIGHSVRVEHAVHTKLPEYHLSRETSHSG